jgi:predicted esterase YcpF (UPF0227 family)
MNIVYIHGFASTGIEGSKKETDLKSLGNLICLTYNSFDTPTNILKDLISQSRNIESPIFIGTSLGGFYAAHLAAHFKRGSVLINPAYAPYETLYGVFTRGDVRELNLKTLGEYLKFGDLSALEIDEPPLVILAEDDRIIDAGDAANALSHFIVVRTLHGGHRYEDLSLVLPMISAYIDHHIDRDAII